MDNLAFESATRLLRAMDAGRTGSRELLELYLERIDRFNPELNAVVALDREGARAGADAADRARARGESLGPLHGLPMTVKDAFEMTGLPCTSGSPDLRDHRPARDADAVQALRKAGAVIFGKTNLPLFAGDFQTCNQLHGQTDNPWDRALSPGGSSGGSAVALAAGLTGLELGSDIGGSLRNPAAFCGVFSHKPSFGIVPLGGHIPPPPFMPTGNHPPAADIAVAGPMARSAADLALAMEVLVGPGPGRSKAWRIELPPARHERLSGFKVGLWLDDRACPVDSLVVDRLRTVTDDLARAGLNIVEQQPEIDFGRASEVFRKLLAAAMSAGTPQHIFDKWLTAAPDLTEDDRSTLAGHIRGATLLHREWMMLDFQRRAMRARWDAYFTGVDALLCPVTPVARMVHDHRPFFERSLTVNNGQRDYIDIADWAGLSGAAWLPSTVVPAGPTAEGLPTGLQIVGPYLEDRTPLVLAGLVERELGGFSPPPDYA